MLYGGTVYVDAKHLLTRPLARGIMIANNSTVGVWATSQSYAKGICGVSPYWDNQHKAAEGYFYHYHIDKDHKAHCWYL